MKKLNLKHRKKECAIMEQQNSNERSKFDNVEMSKLDKYLPRYYKGYDIDILLTKINHQQTLTSNEREIINEVMNIYYDHEFKRREESCKIKTVNGEKIYPFGTMIDLTLSVPLIKLNRGKRNEA